jgi:hypothetical protein
MNQFESDQHDDEQEATADWRRAIVIRVNAVEDKIDANTALTHEIKASTQELVDILQSWKGAMTVLTWVAKFAKPVGVIVAACAAIFAWWPKK